MIEKYVYHQLDVKSKTHCVLYSMGWNYNISLLRYGESWRYHRKICQQKFKPESLGSYHPVQTRKVHAMLQGLLASPDKFEYHNKMWENNVISSKVVSSDFGLGYPLEFLCRQCMATKLDPSMTHASPPPIKVSCLELTWVCPDLPLPMSYPSYDIFRRGFQDLPPLIVQTKFAGLPMRCKGSLWNMSRKAWCVVNYTDY